MSGYTHKCGECGSKVRVPARYVGRTLWCTSCGHRFLATSATSRERTRIHVCEACKAQMRVPARMAGRTLSCQQCGSKFIAKAPPRETMASSVLDRSVQDPAGIGFYLTLPWLIGAAAVFILVWAAVPTLVGPRIVVISVTTLTVAALVVIRDADRIASATGEDVGGVSGLLWGVGVVVLPPLIAPAYAFKRGDVKGFSEHGIGVLLSVGAFLVMLLMTWVGVVGG